MRHAEPVGAGRHRARFHVADADGSSTSATRPSRCGGSGDGGGYSADATVSDHADEVTSTMRFASWRVTSWPVARQDERAVLVGGSCGASRRRARRRGRRPRVRRVPPGRPHPGHGDERRAHRACGRRSKSQSNVHSVDWRQTTRTPSRASPPPSERLKAAAEDAGGRRLMGSRHRVDVESAGFGGRAFVLCVLSEPIPTHTRARKARLGQRLEHVDAGEDRQGCASRAEAVDRDDRAQPRCARSLVVALARARARSRVPSTPWNFSESSTTLALGRAAAARAAARRPAASSRTSTIEPRRAEDAQANPSVAFDYSGTYLAYASDKIDADVVKSWVPATELTTSTCEPTCASQIGRTQDARRVEHGVEEVVDHDEALERRAGWRLLSPRTTAR